MAPPRKNPVKTTAAPRATTKVPSVDDLLSKGGSTPNAPAVDDDTNDTQTTEEHDNGRAEAQEVLDAVNSDAVVVAEVPSVESVELEVLRAQLASAQAQLRASTPVYTPVDESTLSPEEREIRKLRDELAKAKGKDDTVKEVYEENTEGGILVHFLEDGLTSNNRVFVRGQEITFGPEAYKETLDRNGESWLNLDDAAQMARFDGRVMFRKGPWPGVRKYAEPELANVSIAAQAPAIVI